MAGTQCDRDRRCAGCLYSLYSVFLLVACAGDRWRLIPSVRVPGRCLLPNLFPSGKEVGESYIPARPTCLFVERIFTNLKEIENETPLVITGTHLPDGL